MHNIGNLCAVRDQSATSALNCSNCSRSGNEIRYKIHGTRYLIHYEKILHREKLSCPVFATRFIDFSCPIVVTF